MNRKYLVGAAGLILGFIAMYMFTTSYNANNMSAQPVPSPMSQGARPAGQPNQQQMMADVREAMDKAKNNPKDFESQARVAGMYYQIGMYDEAVEYMKKAYDADATRAGEMGIQPFVAQHYFDKKDYAESEKWFRRAIEVDPNDSELLVHLGVTFIQRTPPDPDKAVTYIQSALKQNPKDAHALGHLISAFALKKDARQAEETLNRLKEAEPNNQMIASYQTMIADLKAGKPVTIPTE